MKKQIISWLLVIAFVLSMIPVIGIAAVAEGGDSTAVLTVDNMYANPGDTVEVNLVLTENPGILGAVFTVSWDESLTLVDDASGEAFSNMTYVSPSRYVASGTNFIWYGNEVDGVVNGTVLTLTFNVSESAENDAILPIRVSYLPGDVIDADENDVVIDITDGSVCVIAYKPGDVTGDGRVNVRDLVRLSQYISDGCRTDPDGYNAEVIASVCDVTGDGRINTRDLIRLSQYISDGCMTDPNGYNAVLNHSKLPDCPHSDVESIVSKPFTCTEDGMCTKICRVCNFEWNEVLPASHKYFTVNSLDKEYVKYTCTACGDVYVEDTDGEKVEDASSIVFPMLYASFDDITYIDNIADNFEGISFKSAFATMVVTFTDGEESSSYVNIPTGTSAQNPNGYFEITDNKNAFASETFTISFYAMFEEYPVSGTLDLLSWTIGGTEYVLLTVDEAGNIFVIGNDDAVAPFSDKGWDKITVTVDPATGEIAFELSGADGKTVTGEGDLGASATGETDSHLRFFDSKNQFEAFIDEICISLAN